MQALFSIKMLKTKPIRKSSTVFANNLAKHRVLLKTYIVIDQANTTLTIWYFTKWRLISQYLIKEFYCNSQKFRWDNWENVIHFHFFFKGDLNIYANKLGTNSYWILVSYNIIRKMD